MKFVTAALSLLFLISCSGFKLDTSANCLNEASGCFKFDKTAPTLVSSVPAPAQIVSVLTEIDLTFSEELNNPQPADFILNSPGNGLRIGSVQKIAAFTYRLVLDQTSVQNGAIAVNYSNVKDYNNNKANGTLLFTGNVDIGITFVTELADNPLYRKGVSNGGGYTTTQIQFYHDYGTDNNNAWQIRVSTGAVDCTAGTQYFSGTGLLSGVANKVSQTLDRLTHFAPGAGSYRVIVCIENAAMNKRGTGSLLIVRDDTPPTLAFTPPADGYALPQNVTVTCNDNADTILYSSASQISAYPAAPADPSFNANGTIAAGTAYTTPLVTPSTPNPQYTIYKFLCIDKAGNINTGGVQTAQFIVDTNIPAVSVNLDSSYRPFISSGGYNSTTLRFTTNRSNPDQYKIVEGAISCTNLGTGSEIVPVTNLPLSANSPIEVTLNTTTHFTIAKTYDVRICVRNATNDWGFAYLQITRDDTVPTVTPSVAGGTFGTVQQVQLTCSGNYDKVAYTYTTANGLTVPAEPDEPTFDAVTGNILLGSLHSGPFATPDISTTKLRYKCLSKSGLQSVATTQTYVVDSILPTVTIINNTNDFVSNNVGALNFTDLTFHVSRAGLNYDIKEGSTNCTGGNVLATGSIPAANQNITVRLNTPIAGPPNHFASAQTYNIKICVANYIGTLGYSVTSKQIVRDDTPPSAVSGLVITSTGSGSYTLNWTAATDANGISGYRIFRASTSNGYGAHNYTSTTNSVNISGLNDADTYFFAVKAVDSAGNLSATFSNEVMSRVNLSVNVTGLIGGTGNFRIRNGTEELEFLNDSTLSFTQLTAPGSSYSISITNQRSRQRCSFIQNQYGIIYNNITLNVQCTPGFITGGKFYALTPVENSFHLYQGKVTTIAGNGTAGYNPGIVVPTTAINEPESLVAVNSSLYFSDSGNSVIRRIDFLTNQMSTTSGTNGSTCSTVLGNFVKPMGLVTDGINLYVSDHALNRIFRIRISNGAVTHIAGDPATPCGIGAGFGGYADSTNPLLAQFRSPGGLALYNNTLYVADTYNNRIRAINLSTGEVTTPFGTTFTFPAGITISDDGYLYVSENNLHVISRIPVTGGTREIVAGTSGANGFRDGPRAQALFDAPTEIFYLGNRIFVASRNNHRLRYIDLRSNQVGTVAGSGSAASTNGTGITASFNRMRGITSDGRYLYASDHQGHFIRKIGDNGLVGHWAIMPGVNPIDYNNDNGTNVNNASVSDNLSTTTDRYGISDKASVFHSSRSASLNMAGFPLTNAARTVCSWIKPDSLPLGNSVIFTYGAQANNQSFGLYLSNTGTQILAGITAFGGVPHDFTVPYPVQTGLWTHLCGWYDGKLARVYLNGNLIGQGDRAGVNAFNTQPGGGKIAAQQDNTQYFNGAISDLRLYSRALNESEINVLAQDAAGTAQVGQSYNTSATGLLAHYEYHQGAATEPSGPLGGTLTFSNGEINSFRGKDADISGSVYYNGSTNYASGDSAGIPAGAAPRTVCAFFSPASYPPANSSYSIVSLHNHSTIREFGITLMNISGTNYVANTFEAYPSANRIAFAYAPRLNTWNHLCAAYDGTQSFLYLNGALVNSGSIALNAASIDFRIGALANNGSQRFHGKIDDVRIYNNALTATQIRRLAVQVPAGTIARYDFTGNANDVSGFGNHATVNNASSANGRFNESQSAYAFERASSQAISIPHAKELSLPHTLSVSVWVKPKTLPATGEVYFIMGKDIYGASGYGLELHNNAGTQRIVWLTPGTAGQSYDFTLPLGVYSHIAVTQTGTSINLYVNGVNLTASVAGGSAFPSTTTANLVIGSDANNTTGYFNGEIDDLRLYNRVLSVGEIRVLSAYHPLQVTNALTTMNLHLQAETFGDMANNTALPNGDIWRDSAPASLANGTAQAGPRFFDAANGLGGRPALGFSGGYFDFGSPTITMNGVSICGVYATLANGASWGAVIEKRDFNNQCTSGGDGVNACSFGILQVSGQSMTKYEDMTESINIPGTLGESILACTISSDGTVSTMAYKAGAIAGTGNVGPLFSNNATNSYPMRVGGRSYGTPDHFNGKIADLLLFNTSLSDADREIVQCYLSAKYSIALSNTAVCP